ncbi:MAG TPA: hypothetical protein DEP84_00875, partial [Chloroflexi bacterium]|nr:hypothetical protein [Chloroflexota bacterium]
ESSRARVVAEQLRAAGLPVNATIQIEAVIPSHAGLGSGTQLSLATGAVLAQLAGCPMAAEALAVLGGRGGRSGIGTRTFSAGGFILEGGRRPDAATLAPLIGRYDFPQGWLWIVAIPQVEPGLHGMAEVQAFDRLGPEGTPMARSAVGRIAELVLMQLIPALLERDFPAFGAALSEIQILNGAAYAPTQRGCYAHPIGARLAERWQDAGGTGIGQSSWGPTVYTLAPDRTAAERLAAIARQMLVEAAIPGSVLITAADNQGAQREPIPGTAITRGASDPSVLASNVETRREPGLTLRHYQPSSEGG